MTWNDLKDFIASIPEEWLEEEAFLVDFYSESYVEITDYCTPDEDQMVTYNNGIVLQSTFDTLSPEEQDEIRDDTYVSIRTGEPFLIRD